MWGEIDMRYRPLAALAGLIASLFMVPTATAGIGDLLVAPTRIILNGGRGTEIILKNVGEATATYRISAEFRRMTADGRLSPVTDPNGDEKAAEQMVVFAPRKVTLPPNEPQSIRVSATNSGTGNYTMQLPNSGFPGLDIYVGGNVVITQATVGGSYQGTFTVTADYQ